MKKLSISAKLVSIILPLAILVVAALTTAYYLAQYARDTAKDL